MAATAATAGFRVVCNGFSTQPRKNNVRTMKVSCVASRSDPFKTLSIDHGASEFQVRKAFRKLALKYHPDVCKGNSCGIRFHEINEAYNTAIHNARTNIRFVEPEEEQDEEAYMYYEETPMDDEEELGNGREEWEAWTEVSYGNAAAGAF